MESEDDLAGAGEGRGAHVFVTPTREPPMPNAAQRGGRKLSASGRSRERSPLSEERPASERPLPPPPPVVVPQDLPPLPASTQTPQPTAEHRGGSPVGPPGAGVTEFMCPPSPHLLRAPVNPFMNNTFWPTEPAAQSATRYPPWMPPPWVHGGGTVRGASFPRAENDMMYDPALGISRVDSGAMHNPAFGIKKARSGVMQDLQFGILRANSGSMCDAGRGVPLPLQRAASYNVPVPSLPRSSSCRTTPPATHRVQHMAESLLSRALSPQLARPSPRSPLYSAWPSPADYHALHMQRPVDMQQNSPMLGRHSSLPARPYSSPITGEPNMHFPAMISNPNMDGRQGASPLGQDTMRASAVSSPMTGRRQVLAHHLQLDADPVVAARSSTLLAQPTARQTISPRADEISLLDGSPRPTVQQLPAGCADGALGMAMSPAPGVAPLGAALPELGFAGARRPEPHPHAHVAAVPASWQSPRAWLPTPRQRGPWARRPWRTSGPPGSAGGEPCPPPGSRAPFRRREVFDAVKVMLVLSSRVPGPLSTRGPRR